MRLSLYRSPLSRLRRESSGIFEYQDSWDQTSDCKYNLEDSVENGYLLKRRMTPSKPPIFYDQPDLSNLIDTNFTEQAQQEPENGPQQQQPPVQVKQEVDNGGYDFSTLVQRAYEEQSASSMATYPPVFSPAPYGQCPVMSGRSRSPGSRSEATCNFFRRKSSAEELTYCNGTSSPISSWTEEFDSAVWSLGLQGNLIVAGRSSGGLEVRGVRLTSCNGMKFVINFMLLAIADQFTVCITVKVNWLLSVHHFNGCYLHIREIKGSLYPKLISQH